MAGGCMAPAIRLKLRPGLPLADGDRSAACLTVGVLLLRGNAPALRRGLPQGLAFKGETMRIHVLAIAALLPISVGAESISEATQTREICAEAAALLGSGESDKAYDVLLPFWPLPKEEVQNLGYQTRSQLAMVSDRFGTVIGAEYASSKAVGDSLIKHNFLIKYEKHALRFSCVFYKPRDRWYVNAVTWDDKPHSLLE